MGGVSALALRRATLAAALVGGAAAPTVAAAQDGLIVQPVIPQGFSRDRNVSVLARSRPSYQPIGISVGGLLFFPRLTTDAGVTDNAYLTERNTTTAAFVGVQPALRVRSIWSRHLLEVNGAVLQRNYIGQSKRNESTWNLGANGEVELGRAVTIAAQVDTSRAVENQFSGEVATAVAALSRFRRDYGLLRAEYVMGRVRTFVAADYASFAFSPVRLTDGGVRNQSFRNRNVARVTGQFEYARTPSVSLFAQIGYTDTQFDNPLSAAARLDSGAVRVLGGTNIDLAGRARGTIGIGYNVRDYRVAGFETVRGVVAEARLELFPTPLFTITTGARRTVEDSTFGNTTPQPFWDNRLSLRGDYELLNNLIVTGIGEYALQTYIDRDQRNTTYRVGSSARYLVSRRFTLDASVNYTQRLSSGTQQSTEPGEGRISAGLTFQI